MYALRSMALGAMEASMEATLLIMEDRALVASATVLPRLISLRLVTMSL